VTSVSETTSFPDVVLKDTVTVYGVPITCVGEDGDLLALGHYDDRRTVAAFAAFTRRHLGWHMNAAFTRRHLGWHMNVEYPHEPILSGVSRKWAVLQSDGCDAVHETWHEPQCGLCTEIRAHEWWMRWNVSESDDGAFPVTLWEE
jgi:hypothetical protein